MEKKLAPDGSIFYKDGEKEYRRIVGGLAWPGVKPGFAVVVAEGPPAGRSDGRTVG